MRKRLALVLTVGQCAVLAAVADADFFSGFVGEWIWVREDPTGWQLENDILSIRSDPGALAMDNDNANMPLWVAPDAPFAVEVTVEFSPASLYEQAGLVLYFDDANYTKLQVEMIEDGRALTFTREDSGEFREIGKMDFDGKEVRLRMEFRSPMVSAMAGSNSGTVWRQLGKTRLPYRPLRVGLATGAGSSDDPRWARYSGFLVAAFDP